MESEWEPVIPDISSYKEIGSYIMKTTEETAQMLDDHIVSTGYVIVPIQEALRGQDHDLGEQTEDHTGEGQKCSN